MSSIKYTSKKYIGKTHEQIAFTRVQEKEGIKYNTTVCQAKDIDKLIYKTDKEEFLRQLRAVELTKKLPF